MAWVKEVCGDEYNIAISSSRDWTEVMSNLF